MTADHIIEKIREALEAGPTPGPWENSFGSAYMPKLTYNVCSPDGSMGPVVCHIVAHDNAKQNGQFIAACSPQNIAALLAEITDLQGVVHCMNEDFATLKAERDALRKALAPFARRSR